MLVPVKSFKTTTVYPIGPRFLTKRNPNARSSPYRKIRVVNVLVVGVNHKFEEKEYYDKLKSIVTRAVPDLFVYTEVDKPSLTYRKESKLSDLQFANTLLAYFMMNKGRIEQFGAHAWEERVSERTLTIEMSILLWVLIHTLELINRKYKDLFGCSPAIFQMIHLEIKKLKKFENQLQIYDVVESISLNSAIEYFFMSIFPYLVEYFSTLFKVPDDCTETKKNTRIRKYDNEIFSAFKKAIESGPPFDLTDGFMEIRDKATVDTFEEMLRNNEHETNNIMFIFGSGHIKSLTEKLKNLDLGDINIKLNIGVSFVYGVNDVIEITNKTLKFFGEPERRQSKRLVFKRKKENFNI